VADPAVGVTVACEGDLDEAVIRVALGSEALSVAAAYGKNGKPALLKRVQGYNAAARFGPWLVAVDLDQDYDCAPAAAAAWLPSPSQDMCFRVAVRSVEAWLMADADHLAHFLRVPVGRIARDPDLLIDAKMGMVNLARGSRKRSIVQDMVPREGSGRKVGPAYTSRLIEFLYHAGHPWRPQTARVRSPSLDSLLNRVVQTAASHRARHTGHGT